MIEEQIEFVLLFFFNQKGDQRGREKFHYPSVEQGALETVLFPSHVPRLAKALQVKKKKRSHCVGGGVADP